MTLQDFFTSFPFLLTPVIFWTAWKVIQIENKVLGEIKSDVTEMRNDIKWLVHQQQNVSTVSLTNRK